MLSLTKKSTLVLQSAAAVFYRAGSAPMRRKPSNARSNSRYRRLMRLHSSRRSYWLSNRINPHRTNRFERSGWFDCALPHSFASIADRDVALEKDEFNFRQGPRFSERTQTFDAGSRRWHLNLTPFRASPIHPPKLGVRMKWIRLRFQNLPFHLSLLGSSIFVISVLTPVVGNTNQQR